MPFAVVIHEKGGQPRRQDFDKNEVTIGRVQGNDIVLPKQNVSKKHSRIVVKDGKFIIVDLKSTNGTYVNGRKIASPMVIKETDKIYIGDFILSTEGTGAITGTPVPAAPEKAPEPELPKIEPPRKAPAAPSPAKLVPSPPKPVAAPGRASAPSGAATAVSYGSPPVATPSPKLDNDTVPPIARAKQSDHVIGIDSAKGPFEELLQYARDEGIDLPTTWTPESEVNQDTVSRLVKRASELENLDVPPATLVAELTGAGSIQAMLADETVTAIYVDGLNRITMESGETTQKLEDVFSSPSALEMVAARLIMGAGGVWRNETTTHRAQANGISIAYLVHGDTPYLTIERVPTAITPIETLVEDKVLSDPMAEFLLTALALNRRILIAANQPAASGKLCEALVEASWDNDRVVLLDPSNHLKSSTNFPKLSQSRNMETLCHHASLLGAQHIVAAGIDGTDLKPLLRSTSGLAGGCVLTTRSYSATAAIENLSAGLALSMRGNQIEAKTHLLSNVDVVVQISVDGEESTKVLEILDTNGRQELLFSSEEGDASEANAPAWFEQAVRDGYELNQKLFG